MVPRKRSSGPTGVISEYKHAVSPLDSASYVDSASSQFDPASQLDSATSSALSEENSHSSSSHRLLSPLSHEDVHSHISLTFYSRSDFFDRISSLVHTEPRSYYISDPLPDTDECDGVGRSVSIDDAGGAELESSGSNWSLNHLNPLPSFHTPLSLSCQPQIPLFHAFSSDDFNWDWGCGRPESSLTSSTECDEVTSVSHDPQVLVSYHPATSVVEKEGVAAPDLPSTEEGGGCVSRDSHMTTPIPPPGGVKGVMLESDSVLPRIYPSFPLPSSSHTPSPFLPVPPSPMLSTNPTPGVPQGPSASVSSSESGSSGHVHRREFEVGELCTSGRDSFENIQAHIDYILNKDNPPADIPPTSTEDSGKEVSSAEVVSVKGSGSACPFCRKTDNK